MPTTLRYIGAEERFFETAVTGSQQMWLRNQIGPVSDAHASLLLATGKFERHERNPVFEQNDQIVTPDGDVVGGGEFTSPDIVIFGDSITLRTFDSYSGASVTASGGVATVTMPSAVELLPAGLIVVYSPGVSRGFFGQFSIATRVSATRYTYAYSGSDSGTGVACSVAVAQNQTDSGWYTWARAALDQRLVTEYNAGIGGETSAQALLRLQSDVISRSPRICSVLLGTNDALASGPEITSDATIANLSTIYSALRGAGIFIVAITPPPLTVASAKLAAVSKFIRTECATYPDKMACVDAYQIGVNALSATNVANSGDLWDTVHPGPDYARRIGVAVADAIRGLLAPPIRTFVTAADAIANDATSGNVVGNGMMIDTDANGTADGVTITSATLADATPTVVASPSGIGNVQRVTCTADGSGDTLLIELASVHAALVVGRRYKLRGRVYLTSPVNVRVLSFGMNIVAGGVTYQIRAVTPYNGTTNTDTYTADINGYLFETDWFTVPASVTDAKPRAVVIWQGAGSGVFSIGEVHTITEP